MKNFMKSYAARISEPHKVVSKVLVKDYEQRTTEDVVERGRISKRVIYRTVDPVEKMRGLSALDFALENIIAVGAAGSLKDCNIYGDTLGVADKVGKSIDNVISAVDAEESNLNDKGE